MNSYVQVLQILNTAAKNNSLSYLTYLCFLNIRYTDRSQIMRILPFYWKIKIHEYTLYWFTAFIKSEFCIRLDCLLLCILLDCLHSSWLFAFFTIVCMLQDCFAFFMIVLHSSRLFCIPHMFAFFKIICIPDCLHSSRLFAFSTTLKTLGLKNANKKCYKNYSLWSIAHFNQYWLHENKPIYYMCTHENILLV